MTVPPYAAACTVPRPYLQLQLTRSRHLNDIGIHHRRSLQHAWDHGRGFGHDRRCGFHCIRYTPKHGLRCKPPSTPNLAVIRR